MLARSLEGQVLLTGAQFPLGTPATVFNLLPSSLEPRFQLFFLSLAVAVCKKKKKMEREGLEALIIQCLLKKTEGGREGGRGSKHWGHFLHCLSKPQSSECLWSWKPSYCLLFRTSIKCILSFGGPFQVGIDVIHTINAPRPSTSISAYCKRPNTGQWSRPGEAGEQEPRSKTIFLRTMTVKTFVWNAECDCKQIWSRISVTPVDKYSFKKVWLWQSR